MGHPGPLHPGPAGEEPAGGSEPGRLGLSTEPGAVLWQEVQSATLSGFFIQGMSGELYSLMQKDQEVSLLREASQRCRLPDVGPPVVQTRCKVVSGSGVEGTQAVLVASLILMTSKLVRADLQLLSLRETQVHV